MLTTEQIEQRRGFLGGSDAGGVLGINPWLTPLQVYESKVEGKEFVYADPERLLWGSLSEPMIAQEFGDRTGLDVKDSPGAVTMEKHPFIGGNPDRYLYNDKLEQGILEIKTVDPFAFKKWNEEVPDYYYSQVQHYLMVTGLKWAYLAALVGNRFLRIWHIPAEPAFIKIMFQVQVDFWKDYILKERKPDPTLKDDLNRIFATVRETNPVAATDDDYQNYTELKQIKAEIKVLEERKTDYEDKLKLSLGVHNLLQRGGANLITWNQVNRNDFNKKGFKEAHPDLHKKWVKPSKTRMFLVK